MLLARLRAWYQRQRFIRQARKAAITGGPAVVATVPRSVYWTPSAGLTCFVNGADGTVAFVCDGKAEFSTPDRGD